MQKLFTGGLV